MVSPLICATGALKLDGGQLPAASSPIFGRRGFPDTWSYSGGEGRRGPFGDICDTRMMYFDRSQSLAHGMSRVLSQTVVPDDAVLTR